MNVLEAAQDLVDKKLNMLVTQTLVRLDNLREISLHELRDYINLVKFLQRLWLQNGFYRQHIVMI